MAYITTDNEGQITSCADWEFPGSSFVPYDIKRYPDGRLYSADKLPAVYSELGTDKQQVGGVCPTGWVLMPGPKPEDVKDETGVVTATWVAGDDGEWQPVPYVAPTPPVVISSDTLTDTDVYGLGDAAYVDKEKTAQWLCAKLGL